jgi:hypothetical protein
MSFLDNLENNLKALESREQGGIDDGDKRDNARKRALAEKPWADRLKSDPWTSKLMQRATRAGHERRTKVHLIWVGTTLRMEARGQRLELRPGVNGISAVFLKGTEPVKQESVDMTRDPEALIADWIRAVEEQKRRDDEEAATLSAELAAADGEG